MKRKIGEIYNKPIVEGDKNLVREGTEIHINDLQSNSSSGGGSKVEYWGISDKYNHGAKFEEDPASAYLYMMTNLLGGYFKGIVASSEKVAIVSAYTTFNHYENNNTFYFKSYKAFTFSPTFTEHEVYNTFNDVLKVTNEQGVNLYDLVYPITEEEFYNLN